MELKSIIFSRSVVVTVLLFVAIALNSIAYGMEDEKVSILKLHGGALQAKEYNDKKCLLTRLPNKVLLIVFYHGFSKDNWPIEASPFVKTLEDRLVRLENQEELLMNSIVTFMKIGSTCTKFNNLLTFKVIGNLCKDYSQEHKDQALKTLMGSMNSRPLSALILICSGADVNTRVSNNLTLLEVAIQGYASCQDSINKKQIFTLIQTLIENGSTQKDDALFLAVRQGLYEVVTLLIEAGANVNARGATHSTPLIHACGSERIAIAKILIRAGADVNMMSEYGYNALIAAIWNKNTELIEALTKVGAHLNTRDANQCTPLMLACKADYTPLVKKMIEAGADLNMVDKDGHTALFYAVGTNKIDVIRPLIQAGADVNIDTGNMVFLRALRNHSSGLIKELILAKADIPSTYSTQVLELAFASEYPDLPIQVINPMQKPLAKKSIKTLLMIYKNTDSCVSELPQEILKIIITCAYPEYAIDHPTIASLHPQVLVDTVPLEILSGLIKNGVLQQKSVFNKAWQKKLKKITLELRRSRRLTETQIQSFITDALKRIEASLK